ncbi:MAG: phosphate signaling complex protein PhoU [Oscillospiraceae bacterium]|nr:phosphate signaling complex protein PhoU [Oscillospiraceae bacterium]
MRSKFDEQLRQLNGEMTRMGTMIETAIQDTIDAFFSRNVEKARQIMADDELVDREQKEIETICFQLLIRQQPVARDLRTITAAMKMVTDMERIGDHAADIAELTVMLADSPKLREAEHIRKMAAEAVVMLLQAVEAYVERDMDKARAVIAHDDVVDALFVTVKAELIEMMRCDAAYAEYAADLLMVSKYLERIGDHATNIAEWVIFSLDDRTGGEGVHNGH